MLLFFCIYLTAGGVAACLDCSGNGQRSDLYLDQLKRGEEHEEKDI
jgi:hypothetical protein